MEPTKEQSEGSVLLFMIVLCVSCATVLALLTSVLKPAQDEAQELDRSKEILIAAQLYSRQGTFLLPTDQEGQYAPAKWDSGKLVSGHDTDKALAADILAIKAQRIHPCIVTKDGTLTTFEAAKIDFKTYLATHFKAGFAKQDNKLVYVVTPNGKDKADPLTEGESYIFPVNGQGLWAPIYGYICVAKDADSVIGISWYQQAETPGLGANINESWWQSLFTEHKRIFEHDADGQLTLAQAATAPLGISVVKGKAAQVYAKNQGKRDSSVDGMSGATITGNGVTEAYKSCLKPYRPFLLKLMSQAGRA